jgi:GH25 family lysozyme M1 (1,4-beta-N-acetylmuramidase)
MKKGIDVSVHQGVIDWDTVKNVEKIDFAILQAGYGRLASQKDKQFERNYSECKRLGIPIGAYWYSYAVTVEDVKNEAAACIEVLKGKKFEYPIYFDIEENSQRLGMCKVTEMCKAFCEALEAAGYWVGIYSYKLFLENYIDKSVRTRYAVWLAHYASSTTYKEPYGVWQYSVTGTQNDIVGKGKVAGISGSCDLDYAYIDYPTAIKAAGKNGYTLEPPEPAQPEKPKCPKISIDIYDGKFSVLVDYHQYSGLLGD